MNLNLRKCRCCDSKIYKVLIFVTIQILSFFCKAEYCPKAHLDSEISSQAECLFEGNEVPCNDRIRPGTKARLSCATGFHAPAAHRGVVRKYLTCQADGSWDYKPYNCLMKCGIIPSSKQSLSVGGTMINITKVPWHVGIYHFQNTVTYSHLCGGTIISPNLVISAAHCFWDEANEKVYNKTLFSVAAGKYFRDYYSNEESFPVQKHSVSEILVPSSYKGRDDSFKNDIAVVKLTSHLKFGESIRPVCIEIFERSKREVKNNLNGSFAGWGITENFRQADVLQSLSIQTRSYGECEEILKNNPNNRNYELSDDKFCLYDQNGKTACRGDSGGGFVIPKTDRNGNEYYNLIGIVSHGPSSGVCSQSQVVVMTNVQWFEDLIYPNEIKSEELTVCGSAEWECDDGQCIDVNDRCNGKVDCIDGTDEIAEYCIDKPCRQYQFRCSYGGCVLETEKCNGSVGCADGSDEVTMLCSKDSKELLEAQLRGNCSDDNFMQCKSGECIGVDSKCDGRIDCTDGSDETVELCSTAYCPSYDFQCGYGGCIKGASKCDNIEDCVDGSDEAAGLCGRPRVKGKLRGITAITTTTTPSPPLDNVCRLPTELPNQIAMDLTGTVLKPGTRVKLRGYVTFRCNTNFDLEGQQHNLCTNEGWENQIPTCIKYCPESHIKSKISSHAVCLFEDNQVACDNRIRPETQARLSCAPGFYAPPTHRGIKRKYLTCQSDGTWDDEPYSCIMECGLVPPSTQEFSIGGNKVNITEVPWNVEIYANLFGEKYLHICGGTIITPNLVISAAHCIWDYVNGKVYDETIFKVVAGKYFRDYYSDEEPFPVQKRDVSKILVRSSFRGRDNNYKDDIAVVKLTSHLKFGESIRPVCIEFLDRSEKEVQNDLNGNLASRGITDDLRSSDVLQSVSMQTRSFMECAQLLRNTPNYRTYELPDDKFCLYDEYGSTACHGHSGSGFVILKTDTTGKHYYSLIGIVSHGISRGDCAAIGIIVMTNVQWFEDLINPHILESHKEF